jgi:antitoxin ParD1/3/4
MAGFVSLDGLFAGRYFDREIIILCVRWYLRFKLSFRDLVEMMAQRGDNRYDFMLYYTTKEDCMNAEKLSITLPADMAQTIRSAVSTGAYSSNSEVIREAMRLWQDRRSEREQRLDVIRAKLQEAADDPRRITDDELGRHFDARLAEAEKLRTP